MSRSRAVNAGLLVSLVVATVLAPPASASPDNPCGLRFNPVCAFVPTLPNLDHDVDLTTKPDPANPDAPAGAPFAPIDTTTGR
jgi:hypothetical protein